MLYYVKLEGSTLKLFRATDKVAAMVNQISVFKSQMQPAAIDKEMARLRDEAL